MKKITKYLLIIIFVLVVLTIGVSFSYFSTDIEKENNYELDISSGNLDIDITDSKININNIIPIYDDNYKNESYNKEFRLINVGNLNGCISIYLKFKDLDSSLVSEYIKYRLEANDSTYEGSFKDIEDNKLLLADNIFLESSYSIKYNLYIWISYEEEINQNELLNKEIISNLYIKTYDNKENMCSK